MESKRVLPQLPTSLCGIGSGSRFSTCCLREWNDGVRHATEVVEVVAGNQRAKAQELIALDPALVLFMSLAPAERVVAFQKILRKAGILAFWVRRPRRAGY